MTNTRKPFTVDVDEKLSEEFSAQADNRGYTKYRATEGALRAFIALPAETQVEMMKGPIDTYTTLVRGLVEAEIQGHLDELGPAKEKFLALLKRARVPKSQRK